MTPTVVLEPFTARQTLPLTPAPARDVTRSIDPTSILAGVVQKRREQIVAIVAPENRREALVVTLPSSATAVPSIP